MDYSIVYSSETGNTEILAKAIKESLQGHNCLNLGKPDADYVDTSLVFVGFWTDKGFGDSKSKVFLESLKNKKVFLFGTSGVGDEEYYQKILDEVKSSLDASNKLIGTFMCQGKMPITARQWYEKKMTENPGDSKYKDLIDNFDRALSHPNQADCDQLKQQVIKAISNLS